MKQIGKALAGVLAAVFLGQAVLAAPLLGDVDGDGAVTAKDKMTLARYADGWEGYSIDEDAGDIDRDGDVDAEDAEQLGRYFAGYEDDWGIGEAAERFPVDISIDWTNAVKKEYVDGYVIGSDPADWEGIVVAVTYQDGDIEKYKTISTISSLGLVLTPLNISNRYVTVQTVEGRKMEIATYLPADFNILKREVVGMAVDSATLSYANTVYTEGDTLDLSGVKVLLSCSNGMVLSRSLTNDEFTTNPKHGDKLTTSNDSVLIVYTDVDTGKTFSTSISIAVATKSAAAKSIREVKLLSSASAKREYFIGEAFDLEGFEFLIVYSDATTEVKDLYTYRNSLTIDSNKYSASSKQFTAAMDGDLKVNFNISHNSTNYKVTLTIPNIVVTKRPVLQSIVADCIKDTYMVGESPEVQQFTITAKYDDNSTRVFQFADDVTDTEKAKSTFTDTVGGVTYTIKVTPTRIEEDTDAIRVSYSEKVSGSGSTVTKYDDVEIEVVVPDAILSYYDGGWRTKAYMDFDEALDAAEEYADTLTSSYQQSRKPSIQLCKDITVLYDYSVKEYMEIDLNGFDLIMVPGEIFVKSTSSAEITFTNTASEDGRIIYSNDASDVVVIANGEQCVLDADTVLPPNVYPTSSILNLFVNGDGTITYTPKTSGRLYYYYLKLNVVPAAADFPNLWNVAVNSDVIDVTEGVAGTIIYDTVYAETHPYMVFSIEDESGTFRSPVSILLQEGEQVGPVEDEEVTVASTGFTVEPYCDLTEQAVYFKAAQSGTIYYYFSRTSTPYNESSEDFWISYANATSGYYGSYPVSTSFDYIPFADVDTKYYPGIMLMLVDEHDNEFYPVYVSLTKDNNSIDSTTGITVLSVTSSEVKFSVDTTGVVTYYFMGYGTNTTTHYDSGTTYAYKNGIVTIEHTGRYYSLVIEVEGYEPCVIDLTQDYDRDEDVNDGSNKSGYGFSNYDIEFVGGQIVITGIANVSGTITGSISNVNGSESSVTVTKGDAFTLVIDHDIDSFMNSSTGQLLGAGTLYVQLTAENGDVYERLEVTLG